MSSVVKAKGNMYGWVTHMWNTGNGCSHQCSYCYARLSAKRFGRDFPDTFQLDPRMPNLGKNRIIFVGHMCDMWAKDVKDFDIYDVLAHCDAFPTNKYVFQSKNPARFIDFKPLNSLTTTLGTTIETNRRDLLSEFSSAPPASERANPIGILKGRCQRFITIEPIMDFDLIDMCNLMDAASPDWVNIGADSKKQNLPEPAPWKVANLIDAIRARNIEVRIKPNLKRLLPEEWHGEQ